MNKIREQFQREEEKIKEVQQDAWRLKYHLMPPVGWLNDPNGLCQYQGIYHIFYQYAPQQANGKALKGWGHYTTKDFLHYQKQPTALYPDQSIDRDGAYSGCAFVKQNQIQFFYTGNIKFEGEYDYINEGRGHYVNTFLSRDGFNFGEKKNLLKNEDYPDDLSCHVRDPKIYEEDGMYYMILGARTKQSVGCVIIYQSNDLEYWHYYTRLKTKTPFGYMWECPDFFELNQQKILMTCPQGLKQEGYHYENVYANGYFLVEGTMDHLQLGQFQELDYGFDFYAPQTFLDQQQRRILIGWMGLPDIPYTNPTIANGWQHALTLPRVLTLKNNHIHQYPLEEILAARQLQKSFNILKNQTYHYTSVVCQCHLHSLTNKWNITLREDIQLSYHNQLLTLTMKKSGYGRDVRHVEIESIQEIDIFSDTSSLEIFINHGEYVLSPRVYDDMKDICLAVDCDCHLDIYDMPHFTYDSVH